MAAVFAQDLVGEANRGPAVAGPMANDGQIVEHFGSLAGVTRAETVGVYKVGAGRRFISQCRISQSPVPEHIGIVRPGADADAEGGHRLVKPVEAIAGAAV